MFQGLSSVSQLLESTFLSVSTLEASGVMGFWKEMSAWGVGFCTALTLQKKRLKTWQTRYQGFYQRKNEQNKPYTSLWKMPEKRGQGAQGLSLKD